MKIQELHLLARDLKAQEDFYGRILGLETEMISPNKLKILSGENVLWYHSSNREFAIYHFAFLIPTGSLESAIDYIESKGIELLPHQGDKIIHFENGRSIYFYDADRNIAELIERPLVDYPPKSEFNITDLIKLNEIGLPCSDPVSLGNTLCAEHGILAMNPSSFHDRFAWVGDHEGVLILVKNGRHWLPTSTPAGPNPFSVSYREREKNHLYLNDWIV